MQFRPVLIGIINALIPGLGYLIIKERTGFGLLVLAGLALSTVVMLTDPSPAFGSFFVSVTPLGKAIESIAYGLIFLGFGYDAYDLASRASARATFSMPPPIQAPPPAPSSPFPTMPQA